ncbi:MAG: hypothetical protein AAF368_07365, partial [Planctomycetota bacterium]
DPVLLLAAPAWPVAEMAINLLKAEGIATLFHGQDRGFPEFGGMVNRLIAQHDLYVQRAAYDRANQILNEAWGEDWRDE